MRRLLILGAGAAGTTVANKLRRRLGIHDWTITVVDRGPVRRHRPALLALPFGEAGSDNLFRTHAQQLRRHIALIRGEADQIVAHTHHVRLTDGRRMEFDNLIIATGSVSRPERIPGLVDPGWRRTVHEFDSACGALALRGAIHQLAATGGRLAVYAEQPLTPSARSLDFLTRADLYLCRRGARDTVELVLVAPDAPLPSGSLDDFLGRHKVVLETGPAIAGVDAQRQVIVAADGRETAYDLLVACPARTGSEVVGRSRLGDDQGFVSVHPETSRCKAHADIFAIGSAAAQGDDTTPNIGLDAFADVFVRLTAGLLPVVPRQRGHLPGWLRRRPHTGAFSGHR